MATILHKLFFQLDAWKLINPSCTLIWMFFECFFAFLEWSKAVMIFSFTDNGHDEQKVSSQEAIKYNLCLRYNNAFRKVFLYHRRACKNAAAFHSSLSTTTNSPKLKGKRVHWVNHYNIGNSFQLLPYCCLCVQYK